MPDRPFQRRDAIALTVPATLMGASAGAFLSAIQNALTKRNVGALGVITHTGSYITIGAAMGGGYMFSRTAAANLRGREDFWNPAIGGLVAGGVLGIKFKTIPAVLGYGTALAIILGVFDATGGSLAGLREGSGVDEVARKEALRASRRRPMEEVVREVGEGRGIYPPGYQERRRERLAEKYGIDFSGVR